MAGGISLSFDDVLGRKRRQKREAEAAQLAQNLLDKGAQPSTANQVADTYRTTGKIAYPDYETKALPYDPEVPEGRTTQAPLSLAPKKKQLYAFNQESGQFERGPTETDNEDPDVKTYNPAQKPTDGYDIWLDPLDGHEVRRVPNGTNKNVTKTLEQKHLPPGGGKGGEDPDDKLADDTIKKYQDAKKRGDPLTDEFISSAKTAFDRRGIPFEEPVLPATTPDKIRNFVSKVTRGAVDPADVRHGDPVPQFDQSANAAYQADLAAARRAIANKLVSPAEATRRLQAKYGRRAPAL